eukprot:COSAG06_NODE_1066_length_10841_cov_14.808806_14_plen_500_part_00
MVLLIGAAATARVADAQTVTGPSQEQCDIPDIDECASKPCANGAACTDSLVDPTIPHREYRCACRAGFANGTCAVGWIAAVRQYAGLCAVAEGNCDVDLDECLSQPCAAGTVCYDMSKDAVEPVSDAYRCEADAPDVDSCASNPCGNGAVCSSAAPSPPIVPALYSLGCPAGVPVVTFLNVRARDEFTVYDGENAATAPVLLTCGGACANADRDGCNEACTTARGSGSFLVVSFRGEGSAGAQFGQYVCDVDECASDPCENEATCSSEEGAEVYSCTCTAGWGGDNCQDDIDECASTPCQNGAVCDDGAAIDSYTCTCTDGWEGENCQEDSDECATTPCQNGATCVDGVASFSCTCTNGYEGAVCDVDTDECAIYTPCQNGAVCHDQVNAYSCTCTAGWGGDNCADTLGPPPTFPGSQILSPAQQVTVSGWAPQGPTQTWTLCFSSFTDDASTPSAFHSQCDEYNVTMVVARNSLGYTFGAYVRIPLLRFCLVSVRFFS